MSSKIDRPTILAAAARLRGRVRETPLFHLDGAVVGLPAVELRLKLEQLQCAGSFKARGMFNRLLAGPIPAAGVIAASGGNAGIATAYAARVLGARAEIFVPEVASPAKRARLAALGAEVVVTGAVYAEALQACLDRQRQTGALFAHAYDQPEVIAGAGTLGVEIEAQGGRPDSLLCAVGGGGLIGGLASWFGDQVRLVALEPRRAPTFHAARAAGGPVDVEVAGIAVDSLGARRLGGLAWEATRELAVDSLLLDDEAIALGQRWLWRELQLAVEPAAALPIAALLTGAYRPRPGERVCLVLCGANLDPASLG